MSWNSRGPLAERLQTHHLWTVQLSSSGQNTGFGTLDATAVATATAVGRSVATASQNNPWTKLLPRNPHTWAQPLLNWKRDFTAFSDVLVSAKNLSTVEIWNYLLIFVSVSYPDFLIFSAPFSSSFVVLVFRKNPLKTLVHHCTTVFCQMSLKSAKSTHYSARYKQKPRLNSKLSSTTLGRANGENWPLWQYSVFNISQSQPW